MAEISGLHFIASGLRLLGRRYLPPTQANRASQQYRHYRRQFPEAVIMLQVGKFFEFYERGDAALAVALDLATMRRNRRGARYGFPLAALRVYLPRLLAQQRAVMVIGEEDEYFTAVKTRAPVCRYDAVTSGQEYHVEARAGRDPSALPQ